MTATKATTTSIYAVVGSDESEVKREALELSIQLCPASGADFGVETVDGVTDNAEQATQRILQTVEALQTLPFFGGEKLVWLKNADFLGDSVTGRAAGVLEALEKLTEVLTAGLPEGTRLLLSATEIDKRRSFFKTLGKIADVIIHDKLDASRSGWEEEAAGMVETRARALGLRFQGDALELFTLFTGGDTRAIAGELEKMDLFLGAERREITREDVRMLTPMTRAGVIFELGNALARRDLPECIKLIDQLMEQGESAIGILLVAIVPTVRNLLLVKDLMQRHKLSKPQQPHFFVGSLNRLPPEATAHLPRKKDGGINGYALGIAAIQAHRFQFEELRKMLAACLTANIKLVSSSGDQRLVLTEIFASLAGKSPGK
ncbi:MAG: DNA polymerase III subunit delta [Chthoniobacteraceae bacterium]